MGDNSIETLKKEQLVLLNAIKSETADVQNLEKYLKDLNFQKLQGNFENKWTTESFLREYSRDPLSCVKLIDPVSKETAVQNLESTINYTEELMQLKFEDLSNTPQEDGLLLYETKCLTVKTKLAFVIKFICKSLDSKTVKLVSVTLSEQAQTADLKSLIDACIKMNNIPLVIQSISDYTELDQKRTEFLEEIKKDFAKDILLTKKSVNQNDGLIVLILVDSIEGKALLKIKWAIVSCLKSMKFSYCFILRAEPEGVWLTNKHKNVIQDIVEAKDINEQTITHWKTLCNLVTSHPSKRQKKT